MKLSSFGEKLKNIIHCIARNHGGYYDNDKSVETLGDDEAVEALKTVFLGIAYLAVEEVGRCEAICNCGAEIYEELSKKV